MAHNPRHLPRWKVAAIIAMVALVLPASAAFDWLQADRPRAALALFVAGYAAVIGLIGFLAYGAWSMVFASYRRHRGPSSRPLAPRLTALLREPWMLYFACIFTAGTIGAIAHCVGQAVRQW